jgi:hypothetical protein
MALSASTTVRSRRYGTETVLARHFTNRPTIWPTRAAGTQIMMNPNYDYNCVQGTQGQLVAQTKAHGRPSVGFELADQTDLPIRATIHDGKD